MAERQLTRSLETLSLADARFAGDKGANLGELIRTGVPVPDGFVLGSAAFREFCEGGGLRERIDLVLQFLDVDDSDAVAAAALKLRQMVEAEPIPDRVAEEVHDRYTALGDSVPVAVRSSATAEGTASARFADMIETRLNVIGAEQVLAAVRRCWCSMFGPRVLRYTAKLGFSLDELELAVVVQRQVDMRRSGVVTTDSVGQDGKTLDDERVELSRLAKAIESHYGAPQDVEWSCDRDGRFWILQARPSAPVPVATGTAAPRDHPPLPRTVIVGGGIAAIEALLALHDIAAEKTDITLLSPELDFSYKPLTVEEPFTLKPAERRELAPALAELGGEYVRGSLVSVDVGAHQIRLDADRSLDYDYLAVCSGGGFRAELRNAETFRPVGSPLEIDAVIDRALAGPTRRLAFIVPPSVTWSLPIYELALMTRSRAERTERGDLRILIVSPERAPLALFGTEPSRAVADVLAARRIEFEGSSYARDADSEILIAPGLHRLEAGAAIALPVIEGRWHRGLPHDANGFIPVDDHSRVRDAEDVWAAGDGTNFPVKQGGLATQQADILAADIAARLGAGVEPTAFRPVLRGQLIVGDESLNLQHDLGDEDEAGVVSSDYLWWPPHKVSGRYLAPWLAVGGPHAEEPAPPDTALDLEVTLPARWHEDPMALDPYGPIGVG